MKSIQNPCSRVSTQWVSLVPVHSKWEFILCLHKYFTRPPPFQQFSSCNSYRITTCKQRGNISIIFYPYRFLFQPLHFTIVHMQQVMLVSQFKSCWRVPQVWMSVSFVTGDSVGFCIASHAVPWRAFGYVPSIIFSEPLSSSGTTHDPAFLITTQHHQTSSFTIVVHSSTACRQVHVLHASCHQCATNGTGISRPTTESREEPVNLPEKWHTKGWKS